MTKRNLLSATAGFALLTSLLLGCRVQVPSDNTPSSNKEQGSPASATGGDGAKKSPSKNNGNTDPSTDGEASDPSDPEGEDNDTTPADTSVFTNMHWSTPNGAGVTFYDVEFSSDGTYRKQQIIYSDGRGLLHCEYGSWKTASKPGTLGLVSTCTGNSYEQPWSQSADGDLVLQGVEYTKDPTGVWNCAATECK